MLSLMLSADCKGNDCMAVSLCCSGALSAIGGGAYGSGDYERSDILMDEVECQGFEDDLHDCSHATIHDCDISESASVVCIPNTGE